jgi:hypothetical protein
MRMAAVTASFSYVPNKASTSTATETTVSSGLQFLCFPIHFREKMFLSSPRCQSLPLSRTSPVCSTLADFRRSRQRSRESHHAKQLPSLVNRSNGTPLFIGVQRCRYGLFANSVFLICDLTHFLLDASECRLAGFLLGLVFMHTCTMSRVQKDYRSIWNRTAKFQNCLPTEQF